jgi:phosphoribosylformylglycinamidine synthase
MRFGVVVFPGSNCDYDSYHVLNSVIGVKTDFIWHKEKNLSDYDLIVLPGGFSYGDYLRSGAIARFSPVMKEVKNFADNGGLVLGICNGFQVLLESGMLPGAMLRNKNLHFICKHIHIKVQNNRTPWTSSYKEGDVLRIPIAHADGNYFASDDILEKLKKEGRILFQYTNEKGDISDEYNPNGSKLNIAGIMNGKKNVLGMMPHPERASEKLLGSEDGKKLFISIVNFLKDK